MNTIVRTNAGFFAAETAQANRHIAPGKMRMYFATIEVCEVDVFKDQVFDETQFVILAAIPSLLADGGDKEKAAIVRRALTQLRENLKGNPEHLEQ